MCQKAEKYIQKMQLCQEGGNRGRPLHQDENKWTHRQVHKESNLERHQKLLDQTEEKLLEGWRAWIPATICGKFLEEK
jgi:hypothetical protein